MAERINVCPILHNAQKVAPDAKIDPRNVACVFWEAGECAGSTNPDDCRLIEDAIILGPDVKRVYIQSQPANPVVPTDRFYLRLLQTAGIRGMRVE